MVKEKGRARSQVNSFIVVKEGESEELGQQFYSGKRERERGVRSIVL